MSDKTKRYWWLKLREDFFTQTRIKKMRRLESGDTYTIIYLKMQLLSLRANGIIVYESIEDSIEDELALTLDETVENVKATIDFLRNNNLIEAISISEYMLKEAVENVDSECDSAARMRNLREKEKNASQCSVEASQCSEQNVTCDTEKEKEKEIEIEIEKEKEIEFERERNRKIQELRDYNGGARGTGDI